MLDALEPLLETKDKALLSVETVVTKVKFVKEHVRVEPEREAVPFVKGTFVFLSSVTREAIELFSVNL